MAEAQYKVDTQVLTATGIAATHDIYFYRSNNHIGAEIDTPNYWGRAAYMLRPDDLIATFPADGSWAMYRVQASDPKAYRVYVEKMITGVYVPVESDDGYSIKWGGKRGGQFQIIKEGRVVRKDFKTRADAASMLERIRVGLEEAA